jgi:hypothetical protein
VQATDAMNKMFPDLKEKVRQEVMTEAATVLAPNVLPAGANSWGIMELARCESPAFFDIVHRYFCDSD